MPDEVEKKWSVEVRKRGDDADKDVIATGKTWRTADRIRDGLNINLNHDDYYVALVPEDE
jgi:hypothetical protein